MRVTAPELLAVARGLLVLLAAALLSHQASLSP